MDFGVLHSIPPVTKTLILLAVSSIVLVSFGLVHPLQMIFSPTLVFQEKQYWRLFSTFMFFGGLDLSSMLELQWLYLVSSHIEQQYFQRRKIDYCFTIFTAMSFLLTLRSFRIIETPYLSRLFSKALMYLYGRLLPDQEVQILGLMSLPMRLLPLVSFLLSIAFDGMERVKPDLIANLVGHTLWYLLEIFPRITKLHPLRVQEYFM